MVCKNCGKQIEWYRGSPRVYCDRKCTDEYNNKHKKNYYRKKHPIKTNNCIQCGKTFKGNRKYCSKQCYPIHEKNIRIFRKILKSHISIMKPYLKD